MNQPCMRLFFDWSATMGFMIMGNIIAQAFDIRESRTYTYADSMSPTQATYVRIDYAYVDCYRFRHGKEAGRSLMLSRLKVLQ
jgi:hypothetical protein